MSISTSPPELEPVSTAPPPLRRPARRRRGRRVLLAVAVVAVLLVGGAGAFLAYVNTLPTTVATNIANGQKDVPTDSAFQMDFSRSVSLAVVEAAFSVEPSTAGAVKALSGDTDYAWVPSQPLTELTKYTVTLLPIYDVGHHRVAGGTWTFTTIIVPRVIAVTAANGSPLTDGMEIDPASSLKLQFNDAMDPTSIHATIGGKPINLTWAPDDRSATISTAGIPSGPVNLALASGGRDQSGHVVPAAFALQTGIYWHDHEHTITLRYPALIQVPNDENAWDQNGLQAAGVVFEYLAEGGITRLTAVFQNVPNVIGPMRSSRFISLKIARHYRGLLFQSGESQATRSRAAQDPVPQFFDTIGFQYRTGARIAPDNLMINGDKVQAAEKRFNLAAFVLPKARPLLSGGTPANTVSVAEHYSVYRYDPVTGTYSKTELGHGYRDASLKQTLRIEMVIVLHTTEQLLDVGDGHGAHIHDFDLDSNGAISVYYKGQGYKGTWKSTNAHGPLAFTVNGKALTLPPGLVWIDVTQ